VASALHHALGEASASLGDFDTAERHLQRAFALRLQAAGADTVHSVTAEIALASLLGRRGRVVEAHDALLQLLPRARAVLGQDDANLYTALNDLGVMQLSLGHAQAAEQSLHEALSGRRRLLPAGDMLLAMTAANLAQVHELQGDVEGALALQRETLAVLRAGSDPPPGMLVALENNIAAMLLDLGRLQEAEPHLRRAAEVARTALGPAHPDTLTLLGNLASLDADLGKLDEALAAFAGVIAGREALMGPHAQDTLTSRHGLNSTLWKAGRHDEAASGFAQLLTDIRAAFAEGHPLEAQTEASLARALADAGRTAEARPHAERAVQELTRWFGDSHFRVRTAQELLETLRAP